MCHFDKCDQRALHKSGPFTQSDKRTHPNLVSRETNFRLWAQGVSLQAAFSGWVPIRPLLWGPGIPSALVKKWSRAWASAGGQTLLPAM